MKRFLSLLLSVIVIFFVTENASVGTNGTTEKTMFWREKIKC